MCRAQTSTEYVIAMVGLLITLMALYEVSASMNARLAALGTQMEAQRVAAQFSRAMDAAMVLGPGTRINVTLYSFPAQRLILQGQDIVVLGNGDREAAFARGLGWVQSRAEFYANQSVSVYGASNGLQVQGLGS